MILLTGGARSGKSTLAVRYARRWQGPVTLIATGRADDEEMAARIARHRDERPDSWTVIEEPTDLLGALARTDPESCVIIDCLTLWVTNLMAAGTSDDEIAALAADSAKEAAARYGPTVVVTNEVGSGIVPMARLGRRFRDQLGIVNALWAAEAAAGYLVVAGRVLPLREPDDF